MITESYLEAKKRFLIGEYAEAAEYFKQHGYLLELGYCKLLSADLQNAKEIFQQLSEIDFRANWAKSLVQVIEGKVIDMPSYFQIRNFLEIDLNMLLQADLPDYVENVINGADLFYSINQESYKFIARVMLFNDYNGVALHYLKKAKEKFFYDPEMHLMLATCHLKNGETDIAKKSIRNCLDILPNYIPAKKMLEEIEKNPSQFNIFANRLFGGYNHNYGEK